jgi:hypothetical protein
MNEETIVAEYDTAEDADAAVRELRAANISGEGISQHSKSGEEAVGPSHRPGDQGFWASLFGNSPDPYHPGLRSQH